MKSLTNVETFIEKETLHNLARILNKLDHLRSNDDRERIVKALEKTNYFKDFISNPEKRNEFIRSIALHVEYKLYPKGTALCHQGDLDANFGIIMSGRAIVFSPKEKDDLCSKSIPKGTKECYAIYKDYLDSHDFHRKLKRLSHSGLLGRESKLLVALKKIVTKQQGNPSEKAPHTFNYVDLNKVIDTILEDNNSLIPKDKGYKDLSFEDKLLLLGCQANYDRYFKNGESLYRQIRELKGGDCVSEIALTTDMIIQHTIIAYEDVHLVTLKQQHFRELLNQSPFFQEKIQFLASLFPKLNSEAIFKLCAYTEERVVVNRDYIYKQGDPADAVYIIKSGEVELITYDQEETSGKVPNSLFLKCEPRKRFLTKHRLIAGNLEVGSVFGEEMIKNVPRKYSAVSRSASLLLYTLKREIYFELFEKYMPFFSDIFKSFMQAKEGWRKERILKETQLAQSLNDLNKVGSPVAVVPEHRVFRKFKFPCDPESEYFAMELHKPKKEKSESKKGGLVNCEDKISRTVRKKVEIRTYSNENRMPDDIVNSRLMQSAKNNPSAKYIKARKKLHKVHNSITGLSEMPQSQKSMVHWSPNALGNSISIVARGESNDTKRNNVSGSDMYNFELRKKINRTLSNMNLRLADTVKEINKSIVIGSNTSKGTVNSTLAKTKLTSENPSFVFPRATSRGHLSRRSQNSSLENSLENIKADQKAHEKKESENSYLLYKRIMAIQPRKHRATTMEGFLDNSSRTFSIKSLTKIAD